MTPKISNFKTFFNSLLPTTKKSDILISVEHFYNELTTTIQVMFNLNPLPELAGSTLADTTYRLKRAVKKYDHSIYVTINKAITTILANEDAFTKLLKHEFHDASAKGILDYYQLNLLKYVQAMVLFNDYSRMWLNVVIWESTEKSKNPQIAKLAQKILCPTLKEDRAFVNKVDNIESFATALNNLMLPLPTFLKTIDSLKGHQYNEGDWEHGLTPINYKLDPFQSNFVAPRFNLFYLVGAMLNSWYIDRYERNKAELARLQLVLLALDAAKTSASDPARLENLEGQITYYNNLSNKIASQIEDMEQ